MSDLIPHLRSCYFRQVAAGTKKEEFRRVTPYWEILIYHIQKSVYLHFRGIIIVPLPAGDRKELICRAHISALAAMAGVMLVPPREFDFGVDGTFRTMEVRPEGRHCETGFALDFQAKASVKWIQKDGFIIYDLECKNYNDLVSRSHAATTLILILLCLPRDQRDWHEIWPGKQNVADGATLLQHACYWLQLEKGPTADGNTKRVRFSIKNCLTPAALLEIMENDRAEREARFED